MCRDLTPDPWYIVTSEFIIVPLIITLIYLIIGYKTKNYKKHLWWYILLLIITILINFFKSTLC